MNKKIIIAIFIMLISSQTYAVLPPEALSPECLVEGKIVSVKEEILMSYPYRPISFKRRITSLDVEIDKAIFSSDWYYSGDAACENIYPKNKIITISTLNYFVQNIDYQPRISQRIQFYVSKSKNVVDGSIWDGLHYDSSDKKIVLIEDVGQRNVIQKLKQEIKTYGQFILRLPLFIYYAIFNPEIQMFEP